MEKRAIEVKSTSRVTTHFSAEILLAKSSVHALPVRRFDPRSWLCLELNSGCGTRRIIDLSFFLVQINLITTRA